MLQNVPNLMLNIPSLLPNIPETNNPKVKTKDGPISAIENILKEEIENEKVVMSNK